MWDKIGHKWTYRRTYRSWGWGLERGLARLCISMARWIWRHENGACNFCGALVGFKSTVSRSGFLRDRCLHWSKAEP